MNNLTLLFMVAVGANGFAAKPISMSVPASKEHVVVVGGGIGGLSTSFDLRHHIPTDAKISVVSDRPLFQFTPSNPWVAIGTRTAEDISVPMIEACKAGHVDYISGRLTRVDAAKNEIHLIMEGESKETVMSYDYLVGATGPKLDWRGILDPEHHGSENNNVVAEVSVCTTPHAESGLTAYQHLVKTGGGPIVVGAIQGASCFGPAYEFAMLLDYELRSEGIREKCPITFVTSEPYVGHLGLAGVGKSNEILTKMLAERDIQVLTNCEVNKIDRKAGIVKVTQKILPDGEAKAHAKAGENMFPWKPSTGKRTFELPASFIMMIPQFQGQDCWKRSSKGVADEKGLICIDKFMCNPTHPEIYGVGTCAKFPPVEKTPIAVGAPKTGYLIESMGTAVATNIREKILAKRAGKEPDSRKFQKPSLDTLCLTDFGGTEGALFLASPELPPRRHEETVTGGLVKLAKVAFEKYFLFKIRTGDADPFYEKFMLKMVGIERLEHK